MADAVLPLVLVSSLRGCLVRLGLFIAFLLLELVSSSPVVRIAGSALFGLFALLALAMLVVPPRLELAGSSATFVTFRQRSSVDLADCGPFRVRGLAVPGLRAIRFDHRPSVALRPRRSALARRLVGTNGTLIDSYVLGMPGLAALLEERRLAVAAATT